MGVGQAMNKRISAEQNLKEKEASTLLVEMASTC